MSEQSSEVDSVTVAQCEYTYLQSYTLKFVMMVNLCCVYLTTIINKSIALNFEKKKQSKSKLSQTQ